MKINEVRNDHVDEQNYAHIDVYHTEDDNEVGKTVAIIDLDNSKVFYIDTLYLGVPAVEEAINELLPWQIVYQGADNDAWAGDNRFATKEQAQNAINNYYISGRRHEDPYGAFVVDKN